MPRAAECAAYFRAVLLLTGPALRAGHAPRLRWCRMGCASSPAAMSLSLGRAPPLCCAGSGTSPRGPQSCPPCWLGPSQRNRVPRRQRTPAQPSPVCLCAITAGGHWSSVQRYLSICSDCAVPCMMAPWGLGVPCGARRRGCAQPPPAPGTSCCGTPPGTCDTTARCVQIGLCYQLSCCGEQYAKVWEANGRVNSVVGAWLQAHNIEHCASVQPLYSYSKKKIA